MSALQTRADQLWALLFGTWGSPRRASRMTGRADQAHKYIDIPTYSFGRAHFAAHLAGRDTYAASLGAAGAAWAGCKDYDSADEAEILAALDQARQKGMTAAAIVLLGAPGAHSGGHLWVFYDRPYAESDIRAQLRTIRRSGKGEDYPSGNPIRLPFGYHKLKQTRGTLMLQDGRRFVLDDPDQLIAGIDALLALERNGKPEPAPAGDARIRGAAWGDAYTPDAWDDLPDGGPLWHSAYVAAVARRPGREPLAALLRGERAVITKEDDTVDASDSAQIAALCYNLMSGNVCEAHIRAIALYLKDTIRPGRALEHFKAHVDAELRRYRPKHYKPTPIRSTGAARQLDPLPPPQHKSELKSRARKDRPQPLAGPAGYLAWLREQVDAQSGSVMLSQAQCAKRLGCCVRTIKRYEKALGAQIERRVFAQRQAGCLFLLAPDVVTTSPEDVVIADTERAQQHAENAEPPILQEEHPAPPVLAAPRPRRSALIAEAFDALDGCARRTDKRIRQYLELNYPEVVIAPAHLRQLVGNERTKRRYAKQDARELQKARALFGAALRKKSRAIATAAAQMHRTGDKRAPIWDRRAGIYAQVEAERQQQEAERIARIGYSLIEQAEMLDLVDQVRMERRPIGRATTRPAARGVFPQPSAPAGAAEAGIVARLHALKAHREVVYGA